MVALQGVQIAAKVNAQQAPKSEHFDATVRTIVHNFVHAGNADFVRVNGERKIPVGVAGFHSTAKARRTFHQR